jgi:hypothetical protein
MKNHQSRIGWAMISIVFFSWGCMTQRNPVDMYGDSVDLELLEGEWSGDYFSKDTGRSGTITFTLTAEADVAFGDVLMTPSSSREPYHPVGFRDKADVDPQFPSLLTIKFVEVLGGKIRGQLIPYWDPEMQRRLITTFEGVLKGDTIEGTFESRIEQSPIYFYGQWQVFRKKN